MLEKLKSLNIPELLGSLKTMDWSAVLEQVKGILQDPSSNITAAVLLFSVIVIIVLIIISIVLAIAMGRASNNRRQRDLDEMRTLARYLAILDGGDEDVAAEAVTERAGQSEPDIEIVKVRMTPAQRAAWFVGAVLVLIVLGVALGATTASSYVCTSCHAATPHSRATAAGGFDAHANVACVSCHESSGWLGAVTIEVPQRITHYIRGLGEAHNVTGYGTVATAACYQCHQAVMTQTTTDQQRGVKMAHKQPFEAGAQCLDCHTLATGVISKLTTGHSPCLRCHDGKKQSAECSTCHARDFSVATKSHINPADIQGQQLIDTPNCGACHNQPKQCDPCHGGVRMPHTTLFKWWGHARLAAIDLWDNGGRACARCHTPERRPCTKCHTFMPGHPVPTFKISHQVASPNGCTCHDFKAYVPNRNMCELCHGVKVTQ